MDQYPDEPDVGEAEFEKFWEYASNANLADPGGFGAAWLRRIYDNCHARTTYKVIQNTPAFLWAFWDRVSKHGTTDVVDRTPVLVTSDTFSSPSGVAYKLVAV